MELILLCAFLAVNLLLIGALLHQRSIKKEYQHQITQLLMSLRQASTILQRSENARGQQSEDTIGETKGTYAPDPTSSENTSGVSPEKRS
jgi:hypothetical protein